MKITKNELRQIILLSVRNILNEDIEYDVNENDMTDDMFDLKTYKNILLDWTFKGVSVKYFSYYDSLEYGPITEIKFSNNDLMSYYFNGSPVDQKNYTDGYPDDAIIYTINKKRKLVRNPGVYGDKQLISKMLKMYLKQL